MSPALHNQNVAIVQNLIDQSNLLQQAYQGLKENS